MQEVEGKVYIQNQGKIIFPFCLYRSAGQIFGEIGILPPDMIDFCVCNS
jgi:hypothetical protein